MSITRHFAYDLVSYINFLTYFGLMLLQRVLLISDSNRLFKKIVALKLPPQLHLLSSGFLKVQLVDDI